MLNRFKNAIVSYFQESYEELRKVAWPTRNQAIRLTFIVLGFCLIAAAVMGALDLAFNRGYLYLVDYSTKIAPVAPISQTVPITTAPTPTAPVTVTPVAPPATPTPTPTPTPTTTTPAPAATSPATPATR